MAFQKRKRVFFIPIQVRLLDFFVERMWWSTHAMKYVISWMCLPLNSPVLEWCYTRPYHVSCGSRIWSEIFDTQGTAASIRTYCLCWHGLHASWQGRHCCAEKGSSACCQANSTFFVFKACFQCRQTNRFRGLCLWQDCKSWFCPCRCLARRETLLSSTSYSATTASCSFSPNITHYQSTGLQCYGMHL